LFLFLVAAFQMAWRKVRTTKPPALFTKPDGVLHGRNIDEGGAEQVELSETLYADDTTGALFLSREDLVKDTPLLFQLLADFGLEAHCRAAGEKKESKTLVVFAAKPQRCYKDYEKLVLHGADHGADLSDVDVGGRGSTIHVAESAKYLGSIVYHSGLDCPDAISRINSAKGAFAVLKKCLFTRKDVRYEGKRIVYEGLVLAILLYSSECWCLREEEIGWSCCGCSTILVCPHDDVRCAASPCTMSSSTASPTSRYWTVWGCRPWTHTLHGGGCSGWGMCGG
jgi:hypothetical protein